MARCKSKKSSRHSINTFWSGDCTQDIWHFLHLLSIWCVVQWFLFPFWVFKYCVSFLWKPVATAAFPWKNLHYPYLEEGGAAVGKWSKTETVAPPPSPNEDNRSCTVRELAHFENFGNRKKINYGGKHAINEYGHLKKNNQPFESLLFLSFIEFKIIRIKTGFWEKYF